MTDQTLPAAIHTLFDAFNADDLERAATTVTEDFELIDLAQGLTLHGPDGLRQWLQPWRTAAPDARTTVLSAIVAGNWAATEHLGQGTHTGPLHGPSGTVPATGRRFELRIAEVYELRDGKVARMRAYYDLATFLRQLGLIP